MARVFLGLGSNQGDRSSNLVASVRLLGDEVTVTGLSSIYETEPLDYVDQPWFLNAVCEVITDRTPRKMLELANAVENELGRLREVRYGPRTIDVDILLYDDVIIDEPDLRIPHPRMVERGFVLVPLAEVATDLVHPIANVTVSVLKDRLAGDATVRLWGENWYV